MRLRSLCIALLSLFAVVVAPSAASAKKLTVGISDNSPYLFSDPLFTGLHTKHLRLVVSWNAEAAAAKGDNELSDKVGPYLSAAAAQHISVLVSFEHARGDAHSCSKNSKQAECQLPSVSAYTKQVTAFLKQYKTVKEISPWNEANDSTQPTRYNPKRAGQYAKAVDKVCKKIKRNCTNVVMDVLDTADHSSGSHYTYHRTASFIKKIRRGYGKRPSTCGIHNYADVNRFRTTGTKALAKAMNCKHVWLTETGGIYHFSNFWNKAYQRKFHCKSASACQTKAVKFLFSHTVKAAKHIDRAYVYDFYKGNDGIHDYGLTTGIGNAPGAYGKKRGAYTVVKKKI